MQVIASSVVEGIFVKVKSTSAEQKQDDISKIFEEILILFCENKKLEEFYEKRDC